MQIKRKITFRFLVLFTLSAFFLQAFYLPAYAELPCWNDAALAYTWGGIDPSLSLSKGEFDLKGTQKVADPVNLATGNYYYEHTDISIPSRGLNLEFSRFYNNQDSYNGPLAIGWGHSYNIFLIEAVDSAGASFVMRRNPDGSKDKFFIDLDGTYTAENGVFDALTKASGLYRITTKHGLIYQFNALGFLASITDRNNNAITLTYDSSTSLLTKVADAQGRQLIFEYTPQNKIDTIRDTTGRLWKYQYLNGDLKSLTAPATTQFPQGSTTTYNYTNHNLTSITDARNQSCISIQYDSTNKVETITQGQSAYRFEFSDSLTKVYDPKGYWTEYTLNPDGTTKIKTEQYHYNETHYTYNPDKLLESIVYPKGNSIHYTYDDKGNLLELRQKPNPNTSPLPADIVTTFTYEPRFNFIKTLKDPRLNTTTYYYDYEEAALGDLNGDGITNEEKGNLVKIKYPAVTQGIPETKFTYNTFGQVEKVIDPNQNITKYEYYPSSGYLYKVISGFGSLNLSTETNYDAFGNVKSIKDPKANLTTFEYDTHNNLTKTISALPFSYITKYTYDANDNLERIERETRNPANPWATTKYTYDILDRLKTTEDDIGNVTLFDYDLNGNRELIKDAELNSTTYLYDERNLLWKVTDAENQTTEYTYDDNANLKEIKDAKANKTTYDYDDFDRLTTTTYADYSYEEYTYDAASNLKTKKDPKYQTITYTYDALNRLDLKIYPDSKTVDYVYDLGSRLKDVVDINGTIHYDYDPVNRLKEVTYPGNKTVGYDYDFNSNRQKLTYPDSTYITYEYDELNRLTYIKDQQAAVIAHYQYDALSRRKQLDLANSTQTIYDYDDISRLTSLMNKTSTTTISQFSYTVYDKVGNRKTMTTPDGSHNYTYDKTYQLKTADYPTSSAFADTTFNYDAVGNRTSTVNGGTTAYVPNALNQYTSVAGITHSYDDNGNLESDGTFTYGYDYENRLTSATKSGTTANYKYDAFGRRIQKEVTVNSELSTMNYIYDGDQIIAEYDESGNLTAKYIYGPGIDEPIKLEKGGASYYYHFDGLGSVTNLTDSSGSALETYSYDAFGKPSATSFIGNRYMFTGREYDEETGLYYYRARHYSPTLGRFLQRDPVGYWGGINLYTYCSNNPINWIDPFGLDKQKKDKPWWGYYWEALGQQFNEQAFISNQRFEEFWLEQFGWLWRHGYIDVGYTGWTGKPGMVVNFGVIISPNGLYVYFGAGAGTGVGLSATVNIGSPPSQGTSFVGTIRGGTGLWGGKGTFGVNPVTGKISGSIGGGWGVGTGYFIGTKTTIKKLSW